MSFRRLKLRKKLERCLIARNDILNRDRAIRGRRRDQAKSTVYRADNAVAPRIVGMLAQHLDSPWHKESDSRFRFRNPLRLQARGAARKLPGAVQHRIGIYSQTSQTRFNRRRVLQVAKS